LNPGIQEFPPLFSQTFDRPSGGLPAGRTAVQADIISDIDQQADSTCGAECVKSFPKGQDFKDFY